MNRTARELASVRPHEASVPLLVNEPPLNLGVMR
jgi:hypothetical protein